MLVAAITDHLAERLVRGLRASRRTGTGPDSPVPIARAAVERVSVSCPYDGCTGAVSSEAGGALIPLVEFDLLRGRVVNCPRCVRPFRVHGPRDLRAHP
jgi:hypothetical protein